MNVSVRSTLLPAALVGASLVMAGCNNGGNGDAALRAGPLMFVGAQMQMYGASAFELHDVNGDGLVELFSVGEHPLDGVGALVAWGSPTDLFDTQELIAAAGPGVSKATGDFDGDGLLDLAVAIEDPSDPILRTEIMVLYGTSDGGFSAPDVLPFPATELLGDDLIAGDVNGDGLTDILVPGFTQLYVIVSLGGRMYESRPQSFVVFGSFEQLVDLNHDGRDDLMSIRLAPSRPFPVEARFANADGDFGDVVTVAGFDGTTLATADFDGDGWIDLVEVPEAGFIAVHFGVGDGTFPDIAITPLATPLHRTWIVAAADVNADGAPDLIFSNDAQSAFPPVESATYVAMGNGDGTFNPELVNILDESTMWGRVEDLDQDGFADVLLATWVMQVSWFVVPVFGNGDGTFRNEQAERILTSTDARLISAFGDAGRAVDFDGDGALDIVLSEPREDVVSVLFGLGDGTFAGPPQPVLPGPDWVIADLDGDGDMDAIRPGSVGTMSERRAVLVVARNNGGRSLEELPPIEVGPGFALEPVVIGDFDGNGELDAAVPLDDGTLGAMLGQGDFTYLPMAAPVSRFGHQLAGTGDVDGDGRVDVIGVIRSEAAFSFAVWRGRIGGVLAPIVTPVSGQPQNVFGDFDLDGRTDAVVSVSSGSVPGIQPYRGSASGAFIAGDFAGTEDTGIVQALDIDDDGDLDLSVVSGFDLDSFALPKRLVSTQLLNDGSGRFQVAGSRDVHELPDAEITTLLGWDTAMIDISGDGVPDRVTVSRALGLSVALGRADGSLGRAHYFRASVDADLFDLIIDGRHSFVVGDFDRDGDGDIVAVELAPEGTNEQALIYWENRTVE